jgi:hypothetical protein
MMAVAVVGVFLDMDVERGASRRRRRRNGIVVVARGVGRRRTVEWYRR